MSFNNIIVVPQDHYNQQRKKDLSIQEEIWWYRNDKTNETKPDEDHKTHHAYKIQEAEEINPESEWKHPSADKICLKI